MCDVSGSVIYCPSLSIVTYKLYLFLRKYKAHELTLKEFHLRNCAFIFQSYFLFLTLFLAFFALSTYLSKILLYDFMI